MSLTIPRARARTPTRPNTQLTVHVTGAALRVTLADLVVETFCRVAARVRFLRDFAVAPHESTATSSVAFCPTSPFSEASINAMVAALLSVASPSLGRIFRCAMRASTLGRLIDNAGAVPLATAAFASACAPVVPRCPPAINVCSTWSALARLGLAKITSASFAVHTAVPLALALSALGAAICPVRPSRHVAVPGVIFAIVHFFKAALARRPTVGSVALDVSFALLFGTLAMVVMMSAPMRPRAEKAIMRVGWMCVFTHLQAAFLGLDEIALAWAATLVVHTQNWPLAGAQARAETSICVAPVGPLTKLAVLRLTTRMIVTALHLAAKAISLAPNAFFI